MTELYVDITFSKRDSPSLDGDAYINENNYIAKVF